MPAETIEHYSFAGGIYSILMSGALNNNAFALLEVHDPAGNRTPLHRHDGDAETIHVRQGSLIVEEDGTAHRLQQGMSRHLRPRVAHRLTTPEDEDSRFLLVCSPAGFENFVRAVGTRVAAGADPVPMTQADVERLLERAPHYGIHILPEPA